MGNTVKPPSNINDMIGSYEWKIDCAAFSKMKLAAPGQEFDAPSKFTIGHSKWNIYVTPNGTDEDSVDCFCVSAELKSLPSNWKNITVARSVQCPTLNIKYTTIATFKKNNCYGWPQGTLLLSSLASIKEIEFLVTIRILKITPNTDQQILYKLDDKIFKKQLEIIWDINHEQLNKMKQSHHGTAFESETNINDINNIWYLKCVPNGWRNGEWSGDFLLYLKLYVLPQNISSMKINWNIQIDAFSLDLDYTEELDYEYPSFVWDPKTLSFDRFKSYSGSSLQIKCKISIVSLKDKHEKEINLNEYFEERVESKNEEDDVQINNDEEKKVNGDEDESDSEIEEIFVSSALVLIICISSYNSSYDNLEGCKIDKKNMINLWKNQYGYHTIYNQNDRVNYDNFMDKLNESRNILSKSKNKNKYNAFIAIFSCHGNEQHLICSDGKIIRRSMIIEYFNGNSIPFMVYKPKIIIMDACRGQENNHPNIIPKNKILKLKAPQQPKYNEYHPDEQITLLYSTTNGYAVPDDAENGGNVIRTIYEIFNDDKNLTKYHLDDLFKKTQKKVRRLCSGYQCVEQRNLGNDSHIYFKKKA